MYAIYCNIKENTSRPESVTANLFGFLLVLVACIHIRNFTYASCSHFGRLCVLEPVITVPFIHPGVVPCLFNDTCWQAAESCDVEGLATRSSLEGTKEVAKSTSTNHQLVRLTVASEPVKPNRLYKHNRSEVSPLPNGTWIGGAHWDPTGPTGIP